ncbi:MAG: leucyl aminopeptidase [Candidatus Magasanikiibacteriota bacterium]
MIKYSIQNEVPKSEVLILPVYNDKGLDSFAKNLDKKLGGIISKAIENKDFEGKSKQMLWLFANDKNIPRILLIGLGKEKELNVSNWKETVGSAIVAVQNKKLTKLSMAVGLGMKKLGDKKASMEAVIATEVGSYSYDEHKTDEEAKTVALQSVVLVGDFDNKQKKNLESGIVDGQVIGGGINFARHLGNIPPTIMTPALLANEAVKLGKNNKKVKVKVLSREEMTKLGMGCLLAVARGSKLEPKFIIVEYTGADKKQKPSVLVGKGITYDSGGISLKPGDALMEMKYDMLGAATVLGAVKVLAELDVKKNVVVLVPAAENMPSGDAFRPDDILTAMNGKTVEILNTDAEGRLILADALCYAHKYEPKEVIDLATLTGACVAALGGERSGLFSPEDNLVEKLLKSSEAVGEKLWRLPLGEEYGEAMKSKVADIKNMGGVGGSRYGTASTAAAFLQFFTQEKKGDEMVSYPWAHIDLASALFSNSSGKSWLRHGANGFGVQTLVEYLR